MKKHRKIICLRISLNFMQDVRTTKCDKMDWCFCTPFLLTFFTVSFTQLHTQCFYLHMSTNTHTHTLAQIHCNGCIRKHLRIPQVPPKKSTYSWNPGSKTGTSRLTLFQLSYFRLCILFGCRRMDIVLSVYKSVLVHLKPNKMHLQT